MSSVISQLDPDQLIALLEKQRDLYIKLRELSDKQRTMIAGDRPEMLLHILRDRQDLVTTLARLNGELAPFRRNWDALYTALPQERRERASGLLQEINGLLRVILRTDQEDSALLSARKQAVAAEISATTGGKAANAAYARQSGSGGDAAGTGLTG